MTPYQRTARLAKKAVPLNEHGTNRFDNNGGDNNHVYKNRGTDPEYLAAKIARDRPDILKRMKAGEFKSARAAAIEAGIIKTQSQPKPQLHTPAEGIYCADCVDFMRGMSECVDLTVTSPPYDNLRSYNGYKWNFKATARELFRITNPGGVLVWVVGDATVNGGETGTSLKQALFFKKCGFLLHDTMYYQKTGTSFPPVGRYTQVIEHMYIFSKGKPKTFNPIKDVEKRWPDGSWGKTSRRKSDGSLDSQPLREGNDNFKIRSNIWIANGKGFGTRDEIAYKHPGTFPEQIPNDHIITWSNPGDLVFDPFCGSGTTAKMAKLNGRKYIGVDISDQYCEIARERIENCELQESLFSVA